MDKLINDLKTALPIWEYRWNSRRARVVVAPADIAEVKHGPGFVSAGHDKVKALIKAQPAGLGASLLKQLRAVAGHAQKRGVQVVFFNGLALDRGQLFEVLTPDQVRAMVQAAEAVTRSEAKE